MLQNIEIFQRFQNKYFRIIVNALCYVTNDTLHFNVRDEIKRLASYQRYADRMEEHPNILGINLMRDITQIKKIYVPDRTIIYRKYATGHMLFKIFTNYQMYH